MLLAALTILCLVSWTATAAAIARRVEFTHAVHRFHALAGAVVAAAMATMTVATVVWWLAVSDAAPRFLVGRSSALSASLLAATALMIMATALAAAGARRALRATAPAANTCP